MQSHRAEIGLTRDQEALQGWRVQRIQPDTTVIILICRFRGFWRIHRGDIQMQRLPTVDLLLPPLFRFAHIHQNHNPWSKNHFSQHRYFMTE